MIFSHLNLKFFIEFLYDKIENMKHEDEKIAMYVYIYLIKDRIDQFINIMLYL